MINSPKIILLIVFIILFLSNFLLEIIFLKHLQQKHQKIWIDLGEPNFFFNTSPVIQKQLKEFEKSKKYLELNDLELNHIINWRDKFSVVSNVFIILLTVLVIVAQFIK